MKKIIPILMFLILIGAIYLWKSGNLCSIYVQMSIDNFAREHAGETILTTVDKEKELKDFLIPNVCSVNQFDDAFKERMNHYFNKS
jgi:hypothetical protein